MKIAVIYHSADNDGLLCREVCRHFLDQNTNELVGFPWDNGQPPPIMDWGAYAQIYMLDVAVPEILDAQPPNLIWIDHHKTSIERWDHTRPNGLRIDGVAACRLAWQYFTHLLNADKLPPKNAYVNREVREPRVLTYAGEYDVWDLRGSEQTAITNALEALGDEYSKIVQELLEDDNDLQPGLDRLLYEGNAIVRWRKAANAQYARANAISFNWRGLYVCGLNIGLRGNSQLFESVLTREHQACFGWRYNGNMRQVTVSLYGIPGRPPIDLSLIAKDMGGGGHAGACGFTMGWVEFTELWARLTDK
jgi:hypothetical protein